MHLTPRRAIRRVILAVTVLLISVLGVAPAYAAPSPRINVMHGNSVTDTAAGCDVTFYGKYGTRVCGTDYTDESFGDGTVRRFVIGTDYAIWNIVKYPSGAVSDWRSLGGDARVGVYPYSTINSSTLTIWTYGTNGVPYCDSLANSSWSGFYRC